MDNLKAWLDQIIFTHREIEHDYLDVVVDQCALNFSLLPALASFHPPIEWLSLFQGLPEQIHEDIAPLLLRFSLNDVMQVSWLFELVRAVAPLNSLMVLSSPWPFLELGRWLTGCIDAQWEGRRGLLRFWDPNIFPYLFSDILTTEQQNQLLNPAHFWSWPDRDLHPRVLKGNSLPFAQGIHLETINLNDSQVENIGCISDAYQLMKSEKIVPNYFSSQEAATAACFKGMLLATEQGILLNKDRQAWVLEYLASQGSKE